MTQKRVVLIDGDIVSYRCGFAGEHKRYRLHLGNSETVFESKTDLNTFLKMNPEITEFSWESELVVEPLAHVLSTVKHCLSNIEAATGADEFYIFLSDRSNFRDSVATACKYKGNRDNTRRPLHHDNVIKYLMEVHHAIRMPNLEADDLLADQMRARDKAGEFVVLASNDKDLLQVPGKHYDFVKNKKLKVTPEEGLRKLYTQVLVGDSTDNIPGIYGMGPQRAAAALEGLEAKVEVLQAAVIAEWDKYLSNGTNLPKWLVGYEASTLVYNHWETGEEMRVPVEDFVTKELLRLLRVGVPNGTTT